MIVYDGRPGIEAFARAPQSLLSGMNTFLQQLAVGTTNCRPLQACLAKSADRVRVCLWLACLQITFRRDPTNYRPRINKMDSVKDRDQKSTGNFFFIDSDDS